MRTVLRILGSRYGIALILAVVVLGIVGLAKAFIDDNATSAPRVGPEVTAASTAPAPDASEGDDSVDESAAPDPQPSLSAKAPSAQTVASRFMTAYLKHDNVTPENWRSALAPNATSTLIDKLKATDPSEVPADRVAGDITVKEQGELANATVPVDGGTISLRLVVTDGRWKVDGIDWDPT